MCVFFFPRRRRRRAVCRGSDPTTEVRGHDEQRKRQRRQLRRRRRRASPGVADRFLPSSSGGGGVDRVVRVVARPAVAQGAADAARDPQLPVVAAPPTTTTRRRRRRPQPAAAAPPRRDAVAAAVAVLVGRRVRPVAGVHRHGLDGRPEADHRQGAHVARGTAQPGQPQDVSVTPHGRTLFCAAVRARTAHVAYTAYIAYITAYLPRRFYVSGDTRAEPKRRSFKDTINIITTIIIIIILVSINRPTKTYSYLRRSGDHVEF